MMQKILENNKGFTIIEVILAMLILGIAVVPLASGIYKGYEQMRMGDEFNKASFYLQEKAEEIKAAPFEDVTDKNYPNFHEDYHIVQTVTNNVAGMTSIKRIKLSISKGSRNLGEFEFLIHEKGI
jgi:prepilin-type N-terminal cleavage/methylation domain-containing protein